MLLFKFAPVLEVTHQVEVLDDAQLKDLVKGASVYLPNGYRPIDPKPSFTERLSKAIAAIASSASLVLCFLVAFLIVDSKERRIRLM